MLNDIKHLILDMDGVLWRGDTPMPNLPDFFDGLKALGIRVAFATNNASKTPDQYVEKFGRFGVTIQKQQVMTSALATAAFLKKNVQTPGPIYAVGAAGLLQALTQEGFDVLPRFEKDVAASAVAVGFNQQVTYDDFAAATYQIRYHAAAFVGCNPDVTFPSEQGLMPGNGSLIALIEAATDQKADIIGKPFPRMFEACLDKFGPSANGQNTAIVGDRLNTDILGGKNANIQTALVLSGVTQPDHIPTSEVQPDAVYNDIHHLLDDLANHHS